jgi:hypothetical protein
MYALINTRNLYSVRAACPDCRTAGHALPDHGHPETIVLSTIDTEDGPIEMDAGRRATDCHAAEPEFWAAAAEGRIVEHTYDCPDKGSHWDVAAGRWNAVITGEDHITRLHGPGHMWDERFGVVRADDPRVAA